MVHFGKNRGSFDFSGSGYKDLPWYGKIPFIGIPFMFTVEDGTSNQKTKQKIFSF